MHRTLLLLTALLIGAASSAALPAEPPAVGALKALGVNVGPAKEGGWSVDVRDAKCLTPEVWTQIEAMPDIKRFSGNGELFDDAALARLAKIGSIESFFFNGPAFTDQRRPSLTDCGR